MKSQQEIANQQQPNQIFELLKSLLQTSQAQAGQMQGTQSEIQSNEQRMGKPQQNAYQKGVDKALNESGYAHASEAILKGADPMMVAQQSSQMGAQQSMNNVAPLLQTLLSMAQPQQQQQTAPQQQILDPIQQQAQQLVEPKGFMGRWQENFNKQVGNVTTADKLGNLASAQKLLGQEPIQPSTMLQQNIEIAKSRANMANSQYQNIVSQENQISQQYIKDFEPLKLATDSVGKITSLYEDSLKNPNNNVNDFFLVYNAIKAADPTAVKEGEYKTVQDLMPLAAKVLNGINFKIKGETLTPDQRRRLVQSAVTQYNGLAKRFEPLAKQYEKRVRDYGGDPSRALVNYGAQGKKSSFKVTQIGD